MTDTNYEYKQLKFMNFKLNDLKRETCTYRMSNDKNLVICLCTGIKVGSAVPTTKSSSTTTTTTHYNTISHPNDNACVKGRFEFTVVGFFSFKLYSF